MNIGPQKISHRIRGKRACSIINLRLNMINVKGNYINSETNTECELCESDDTTEHLLECSVLQRLTKEEMKATNLESVDSMHEIRRITRYIERVNEIKNKMIDTATVRCSLAHRD